MDYLILALATWRISSLLVTEAGPMDIFERMRHQLGVRYDNNSEKYGTNALSEMLICVWCTSVWVAVLWVTLYALWPKRTKQIALPLALSAGAILVEGHANK